MPSDVRDYPWFSSIDGDDIEQGDIFEGLPVFIPPADLKVTSSNQGNVPFTWKEQDLIVMSQSCDLVKGREKVEYILMCAVWIRSDFPRDHHLAADKGMEEARRGQLPSFHVLADCTISGFEREVRVVDFRNVYSLPLSFVRNRASDSKRLRLLPPYREHLSQSFARFFMRVGLPIDIPSFTKK